MKINQLFKSPLPDDLFKKILTSFGYENVTDDHSFSKVDLEKWSTVDKFVELKEELSKYYLPCKAKLYLTKLDENKVITVFRQILRLNGLALASKQKYIKQRKTTIYYVQKKGSDEKALYNIKIDNEHKVISFM